MSRWISVGIYILIVAVIVSAWWNNQEIRAIGLRVNPKVEVRTQMTQFCTWIFCENTGHWEEVCVTCDPGEPEARCHKRFEDAVDAALAGCEAMAAIFKKHNYDPRKLGPPPIRPKER